MQPRLLDDNDMIALSSFIVHTSFNRRWLPVLCSPPSAALPTPLPPPSPPLPHPPSSLLSVPRRPAHGTSFPLRRSARVSQAEGTALHTWLTLCIYTVYRATFGQSRAEIQKAHTQNDNGKVAAGVVIGIAATYVVGFALEKLLGVYHFHVLGDVYLMVEQLSPRPRR